MKAAPTPEQVELIFTSLIDGRCTRDEADRWAAQWFRTEREPMPEYIWEALGKLFGCDLRDGPGEPYLHSDEQILDWLETFRRDRQAYEN